MENKIYQKLKEDELKCSKKYEIGLSASEPNAKITGTVPKKNIDLELLLVKMGLIESNEENKEKINNFYDYLFKFGIELGLINGKNLLITYIKNDGITMERINKIDTEKLIKHDFLPGYLYDLKEAISNEK